jgi:hypothetical protein
MRTALLAAGLTLLLSASPAFAADLAGTYDLKGWNPGAATTDKPSYLGTLTLVDNGHGFDAAWVVGANKAVTHGTALAKQVGDRWALAIAFLDGPKPQVALYSVSEDGKTLEGDWTAGAIGHERAVRK